MTKDEALKLALEALKELVAQTESRYFCMKHDHVALQNARHAIARAREALAPIEIEKELALQKLHDENERLGLYEDAYEEKPEEEPLHPVHIGVDVTKEGTAVTAFYRKPDAVMEMFYSQFHPLAQPEQEPVAWVSSEELLVMRGNALGGAKDWRINVGLVKQDSDVGLYTTPPQRTWVGLTEDEAFACQGRDYFETYRAIEAKLKEKNCL